MALGALGAAAKEVEFQGCCCCCWQLAMQRNNFAYCIEMQLRLQREEGSAAERGAGRAGLDLRLNCGMQAQRFVAHILGQVNVK